MNSPSSHRPHIKPTLPHEMGDDGVHCRWCQMNLTGHMLNEPCFERPESAMSNSPEALTIERKSTHGDWNKQAASANSLKTVAHDSERWNSLSPGQQEAIDMILTKVSRIVSGNPNEADHWDDIAGYAYLGKGGHGQG